MLGIYELADMRWWRLAYQCDENWCGETSSFQRRGHFGGERENNLPRFDPFIRVYSLFWICLFEKTIQELTAKKVVLVKSLPGICATPIATPLPIALRSTLASTNFALGLLNVARRHIHATLFAVESFSNKQRMRHSFLLIKIKIFSFKSKQN